MTTSPERVMADRNARRLAIACVHLACCAVESSAAVDDYLSTPETASGDPLNVLVVAGTVTRANEHQILAAYEALAEPRVVVAFGVCAISGGPYWDSYAVRPGIEGLVPVDVVLPGCPPTPDDLKAVLVELARGGVPDDRG